MLKLLDLFIYHNILTNLAYECRIINLNLVSWFDAELFNSENFET